MATTHDPRFREREISGLLASRIHRPKALLAAEMYLVVAALALLRLTLGGLLIPGFLTSPDNVPPFVVDVALRGPLAVAAFGLPMGVAVLALTGTRLPGRVPWSWSHVGAAWLVVAFAELPLVSADLTAAVFAMGAIPAALIGSSLLYLRRSAGEPWKVSWTLRRRLLLVAVAAVVAAFWAVYLYSGVVGMDFRFPCQLTTQDCPGPAFNGTSSGPFGR